MSESSAECEVILDVNKNAYEIGYLNSNEFDPKYYATCDLPATDDLQIPNDTLPGIDMIVEQGKDEELVQMFFSCLSD